MNNMTTFEDFLIASVIAFALIVSGSFVFNFLLRRLWRYLRKHEHRPHFTMQLSVLGVFVCHTFVVWMYGLVFWLSVEKFHFGALTGDFPAGHFLTYIYFSATTYSSLGFGDIEPLGAMRFLTGVEAINGLILIGWSVTYTYFATERYLAHESNKPAPPRDY